jgi:hypothetical protein
MTHSRGGRESGCGGLPLERTRFWPEATEEAFWHWKTLARLPLNHLIDPLAGADCGVPECGCYGVNFRDHLEAVIQALPRKSARELRALVWALDEKILTGSKVIPAKSRDVPWWRGQLQERARGCIQGGPRDRCESFIDAPAYESRAATRP